MKNILHGILLSTILVIAFMVTPLTKVHAQSEWAAPCVGRAYDNKRDASDVPTIQGVECLVANILASAITLIGIAAFVMFLAGGFQYLTAGANAKGVESGKNTIGFAILGIVVALASFMILNVLANLTGVQTILKFQIIQLGSSSSTQ
jgi:hypothetical protein